MLEDGFTEVFFLPTHFKNSQINVIFKIRVDKKG